MPCGGSPDSCGGHSEPMCDQCGCMWDYEFDECDGTPDECSVFGSQEPCEDCGCDWTAGIENVDINIADVWKDVAEMQINIGDVWKDVVEVKINIGDVWKTVYIA